MFGDDPIDRRQFVKRAGAVTLGSVAVAGCGGGGDGDDGSGGDSTPTETEAGGGNSSDFGGWLQGANNFGGSVVDRTGSSRVTIEVGAGSSNLAFAPPAVRVSTGTTVRWKWTGKGGMHNVHAVEGASFESDLYSEAGVHFTHTFDESGTVKYQCDPHAALGMKGVVVVA